MSATATKTIRAIRDRRGRSLGKFEIDEETEHHYLGSFVPGPDYPAVEPLFLYLEELIDGQVLSLTDDAQAEIEKLGLTYDNGEPVFDLQIFSVGDASARIHPWSILELREKLRAKPN